MLSETPDPYEPPAIAQRTALEPPLIGNRPSGFDSG